MNDHPVKGTENIIAQMRSVQDQFGYLPASELQKLSKETGVPLFHLHGVADFFPHFNLTPPPKVTVRVCSDMSCHLRGADPLRQGLKQRFASMSDRDVEICPVSCLGQCDGAPAASVNDHVFRNVNGAQLEALTVSALGGSTLPHMEPSSAPHETGAPFDIEPYSAFRKLLETRDFEGTIALLKTAGLPGLGGA